MGSDTKVYTLAEVSKHNSNSDCWLIIGGKVFLDLSIDLCSKISSFGDFLMSNFVCLCLIDPESIYSMDPFWDWFLWKKGEIFLVDDV